MPRYDYECKHGHRVELNRPLHKRDWPLDYCRECDAAGQSEVDMTRVPAAPGFVIRGFNAQNGYSK